MAVNIPLNKNDKNSITIISSKHLVINIIRCFFIFFLCFVFFNPYINYSLACKCDERIKKENIKRKENKPAEPRVIYLDEYKNKIFVGVEKCKVCHSVEYRKWQMTKHAQAYEDMKRHYEEEKDENKKHKIEKTDCESCHTTGYGYKFGFIIGSSSDKLVNVQCEMCHGPGEEHVKNYKQKMVFGENPIPEALCRNCHCEEIDPGFQYIEYLGKINCITVRKID